MNQNEYRSLFKKICIEKNGKEQYLEEIESRLKHLRKGGALAYSDLEAIADDKCWPFNNYWMWPSKEQIEKKLIKTSGCFMGLPDHEEDVIKKLIEIFRNLALVSIVLRFIWPEHYAIYSRPPLKILRLERGANETEEYMKYLEEMRILKRSFNVLKTSEVDMIVWAILYAKGRYWDEFKKLISDELPENLSPEEIIKYLREDPLRVAEIYFIDKDFGTAGFWASRAYEKILCDECRRIFGFIPERTNGELETMINKLSESDEYSKRFGILHRLRRLRNRVIHSTIPFTLDKADELIKGINKLKLVRFYGRSSP